MAKKSRKNNTKGLILLVVFIIILFSCIFFINKILNVADNRSNDEIIIKKGKYRIDKNIYIPSEKTLILEAGTTLRMEEGIRIIINGRIIAKGTKEQPIIFQGDNTYWRGIILNGNERLSKIPGLSWTDMENIDNTFSEDYWNKTRNGNQFNYCIFENIKFGEEYEAVKNNHRAAIEAYNTSILIANSIFRDIKYIGGIQIKNSYGSVFNNSLISNGIHKGIHTNNSQVIIYKNLIDQNRESQPCNDGLWLIESLAIVYSNTIKGKGDDAIDIKGGYGFVLNNLLIKNKDEGIDVDSGSKALLYNNTIINNSGSGILVSKSESILVDNSIYGNLIGGLTIRNKGLVYSVGNIIKTNTEGIKLYFDIDKDHEFCEFYESNLEIEPWINNVTKLNKNNLLLRNSIVSDNNLIEINNSDYSLIEIDNSYIKGGYKSNDYIQQEFIQKNMLNYNYTKSILEINRKLKLFENEN